MNAATLQRANVAPSGFTIGRDGEPQPDTGYMVARTGDTRRLSPAIMNDPAKLAAAITALTDTVPDAGWIGGWVHDGHLWLEPADHVTGLDAALALGRQRGQIAVFDLTTRSDIPVAA